MMYRFTLDTRRPVQLFPCPLCNRKELKRYVDTESGSYLPEHVGRCNREINCGYHCSPKQHYSDIGQPLPGRSTAIGKRSPVAVAPNPRTDRQAVSVIPFELFRRSLESVQARQANNLVRYLQSLFSSSVTADLVRRYFIGSSKHWDGATVFWQVDKAGNIRGGKVMLYDPRTGKRSKEHKPTWVHSLMELPGYQLRQCLFGEHLLKTEPAEKPVAIVESEKTAIISSVYLPNYIWLACGGLQNLSVDRCRILSGRKVMLYPDLGCFDAWSQRADEVHTAIGCQIVVSDLLETSATDDERMKGLDIADYLIRVDPCYGWAVTDEGYPVFWDC